jgi:hypothetical protein
LNDGRLSEKDKAAFTKGKQQCLDLVLQGRDPQKVFQELLDAMRKDISERTALG